MTARNSSLDSVSFWRQALPKTKDIPGPVRSCACLRSVRRPLYINISSTIDVCADIKLKYRLTKTEGRLSQSIATLLGYKRQHKFHQAKTMKSTLGTKFSYPRGPQLQGTTHDYTWKYNCYKHTWRVCICIYVCMYIYIYIHIYI